MNSIAGLNSDVLKSKIRLAQPRLREQLLHFWTHPNFEQVYKSYAKDFYFSVNASIPLFEVALAQSKKLSSHCPVAMLLVPYLAKHIEEERNHDKWLLEDLAHLGIESNSITSVVPPTSISTLIGSQYYFILHSHPVSIMAYLAVVEGYPPRKDDIDSVIQRTALPKEALSALYKHAEIDIHHSKEIWSLLDSMPLTNWHCELLGKNSMLVIEQSAALVENTLASFE